MDRILRAHRAAGDCQGAGKQLLSIFRIQPVKFNCEIIHAVPSLIYIIMIFAEHVDFTSFIYKTYEQAILLQIKIKYFQS